MYDTDNAEDVILKELLETNLRQRGIGNLNPIKFARCIVELERIYGVNHGGDRKSKQDNLALKKKQTNLADELNVSRQTVQDYKKLLTLIPELQELIETGQMTSTVGYKVWAKLPQDEQKKLVEELGSDAIKEMTQKQTEEYLQKIKELENVNAGYEMKLEAAMKKSNNSETLKLMEEKEVLTQKLRDQYEKSQQLKKQLDEAKKKGSEIPEDYAQIKADYEKSQRRIEELEINLKNERTTNQIKKDVPKSQFPIYDFEHFNSMCASFLQHIGYYSFKEVELGSLNSEEAKAYYECIDKVEECLSSIKSLINKNKKEIA